MTSVKPVALITGASSGIGRSLADVFAARQYDLVLVARNEARLHEAAQALAGEHGAACHVVAADLVQPGAPLEIMQAAAERSLAIDVLVNNAGYGVYGSFADANLRDNLDMIQVNVTALTHLTGLVLPQMLARRSGRILNVASTAAFQPGPFMAGYFATKAFVLSFSEALAAELNGTGVTVTALCPGPIQTGFQERARMAESNLVHGRKLPGPAAVARAAYRGLMRGDRIVIPSLLDRLLIFSQRFVPRRLTLAIAKRVLQRRYPA